MTIVGGILLIALFPAQDADSAAVFYGTGGALIGVAVLVTVYEMIMVILALAKKINHPARLLVDIILNSAVAVPAVLATLALIVIASLLFAVLFAFGGIIIAVFAFPLGFGFLHSIAFIVSAISSCVIRSKLIREAREEEQRAPVTAVGTAPNTFVMVPQQPTVMPQSGYPPNYNDGSGPGQGYQAGYPMPAGVYQNPYYAQPLPHYEANAHSINNNMMQQTKN